MTLAEVQGLAEQVLERPGARLDLAEMYRAVKPLHSQVERLLAAIWSAVNDENSGVPKEEREAVVRLSKTMMAGQSRKHAGTGRYDTTEQTWEEMRTAALAGENLASLGKRFGVLYGAILKRRDRDEENGKLWTSGVPAPNNLIDFMLVRARTPLEIRR